MNVVVHHVQIFTGTLLAISTVPKASASITVLTIHITQLRTISTYLAV